MRLPKRTGDNGDPDDFLNVLLSGWRERDDLAGDPHFGDVHPGRGGALLLGLGARAHVGVGRDLADAFRSGYGVPVQGQHAIIFPGIALSVLSVSFIGDGLRDALDPRRRS